ncbi:collagen alpha-1(XII) chain-like [Physella acuta]|uniref:collagen alpha-1(XII) chain-like n=1 Tax=Physella acuta TaxID=109671 RepID=UPI0027DE7C5A|nr:collagen alpha-1(XII) chain-like [Physella acuta]
MPPSAVVHVMLIDQHMRALTTKFAVMSSMTEDVKEYCGNIPADVVFVLDSSNSVHDVDFKKQLDFVSDVASMFQIGENMTQVGLLTFTERVHLNFFLNAYKTKASLIRGIKSTYKENGLGTRTDLALHFMRKRMFVPLTGARENVSRVAIIITDGKSEYPIKTLIESQIAKKQGIHIFTVGVGVAVNDDEMRRMASYPPDENAFTVKTYSFLDAIKNKLAVRTCTITTLPPSQTTTKRPTTEPSTTTTSTTTTTPTTTTSTTTEPTTLLITEPVTTTPETTTTTTTTTTTPTTTELPTPLTTSRVDIIRKVCEMKTVDVVFALDSSTNISPMAFWHQVKFVRDVTVGLDIGFDRTRIGVVIYSDKVVSVFNVNDHETLNEALTKLYKIERTEGSTKIDEVIHYVRTKNFKRSVARKDVAQLMVLITGSSSKNLHKVKKEASMARKTGIEIMAIGVGRKYNPEELQVLAGLNSVDSSTDNKFAPFFEVGENTRRRKTFIVGSFSELDTIVTETAVELCTGG